ncbi:hypothetical protein [Enterococcus sp. AZ109]|uniref:hypothetical protein n=1 Tax=Enterococcus sp. AZ109 TaxID=2774634 RepID=UPI003F2297D2
MSESVNQTKENVSYGHLCCAIADMKHQSLEELTNQSLEKVVKKINLRPRKCLEWKAPYEVFFDEVLHLI